MTTTTFVTGVTVIEADWLNDVDASTYGTRPVATGGTGATTAADARTNLGLGSVDNTADTAKPVSTAQQTALDLKANLASPTLTGTPIAPTAAVGTNTTQIATTAHVFAERTATATLTNKTLASPVLTGSLTLPAVTLSGAVSGGAQEVDNVVIGANTPLAGGFTTLSVSGLSSFGKVTSPTCAVDTTSFGTKLVTNTAATYTVLTTDGTIIQTTAAATYTLPAASSFSGRILKILTQFAGAVISASSNVVPITGGAAGTAILAATAGKFAVLQSNGTNWLITEAN